MRITNKNKPQQSLSIFSSLQRLFSLVCCGIILFTQSYYVAASSNNTQQSTSDMVTEARLQIDVMEQEFNQHFYDSLSKSIELKGTTYQTIEQLNSAINMAANKTAKHVNNNTTKQSNQQQDTIYTVALVVRNLSLLKNNYDHPDIYRFIQILLENNEMASALSLINTIEQEADLTTINHSHYLLAYFYFQRQQWQSCLDYLTKDALNLAPQTYQHRLLIKGYSLQKLSRHQQAKNIYEKIPVDSLYYDAARLNIALVNLRLGAWTQAHNLIKGLSHQSHLRNNEPALNRLYITLGYSLLKKGYYRDATDSFKHVGINSRYANQALLGIALTAAQQDDFINALNASRLLKSKPQDDLPIDEAQLLMPFFYEKSQQWTTASIGYTQANIYYQQKIDAINTLLSSPINFIKYPIRLDQRITLPIEGLQIDFSDDYPNYFFIHRARLAFYQSWLDKINNRKLNNQFKQLLYKYDELTQKMTASLLDKKRIYLNSYLDQTRYGLARLYDNNTVQK